MRRSPSRCTSKPLAGAAHNRISAKAVMTNVAAPMLTPKLRAYCGSTGATTPYPRAITDVGGDQHPDFARQLRLLGGRRTQVILLLACAAAIRV